MTLERTFQAPIEEVWDLWTTKEGIESWWGPDGFAVKVHRLDLRPGGDFVYAMTAIAPDQLEFLEKAGMPATTESRATFTEVDPPRRLSYNHLADFIPGVEPYQVPTTVELEETPHGVRLTLSFEAMHEERWTNLAVMGWEAQLNKLAKLLEA
jgi:uncharacterized protein YndB with AHSA1/START domain